MVVANEIIRRDGLEVQEYIDGLLGFLRMRTGFEFESFSSPAHLQKLLDEMAFNRVPLSVWNCMLTSVLRIVNMSQNISQGFRHFGAFFIDVLVWLFRKLTQMGLLRIAIFLCLWFASPVATFVITVICCAVNYFMEPLWLELSKFIKSHLKTAPYHTQFLTMG